MDHPRPSSPVSGASTLLSVSPDSPLPSLPTPKDNGDHRTLRDQIHVAYALDNFHLARLLLLKLHGVNVLSDDDPRIANVKDEDFDFAFLPNGTLSLAQPKLNMKPSARPVPPAHNHARIRAREQRLRNCERIWQDAVCHLRDEKERLARLKEDRLREQRKSYLEAKEREREVRAREAQREQEALMRCTRQSRVPPTHQRAVLSYGSLPASSSRASSSGLSSSHPRTEDTFHYAIMQPVRTPSPASPRRSASSSMSPLRAYNDFAATHSRTVTFDDVVACMHGPLFPHDFDEVEKQTPVNAARVQLLEDLLSTAAWDDHLPQSGVRTQHRVRWQKLPDDCVACSLDSMPSSHTAVSSVRTESITSSPPSNSWFSFSVRVTLSNLVTPALPSSEVGDVPTSAVNPEPAATSPPNRWHSCIRSHRVAVDTHPLDPFLYSPNTTTPSAPPRLRRSQSALSGISQPTRSRSSSAGSSMTISSPAEGQSGLLTRATRSMIAFVDMATSFQRAYVRATMFNTGSISEWDGDDQSRSRSRSGERSVSIVRPAAGTGREYRKRGRSRRRRVKLQGYRASPVDVAVFTSLLPPCVDHFDTEAESHVQYNRPLVALRPLAYISPSCASPSHSAHVARKLPPPAQPPRSPFRHPHPPLTLTSRLRPIANPLLLRLKALQNSCNGDQALILRGANTRFTPGLAVERQVREKLVGVAWEGIGRSGLSWEVSVY